MLARHLVLRMAAGAGMHGDCRIDGPLHRGLTISRASFTGPGPLAAVKLDQVQLDWHWREIIGGKLRAVHGTGIDVIIDLPAKGAGAGKVAKDGAKQSAADSWAKVERLWTKFIVPLAIDLRGLAVQIHKEDKSFVRLAPSDLRHTPNAQSLNLTLGEITGPDSLAVAAQNVSIAMTGETIVLDQLSLPGNILLGPVQANPVARTVTLAARQQSGNFHLHWDATADTLTLAMDEGEWDAVAAMRPWLAAPAHAALHLSSLRAVASGISQTQANWRIQANASLSMMAWDGWQANTIGVQSQWDGASLVAILTGKVQGSPANVDLKLTPGPGGFTHGKAEIKLATPDLGPAFGVARDRYFPGPTTPLQSTLDLGATLNWHTGTPPALQSSAVMRGTSAGGVPVDDITMTLDWPDMAGAMDVTLATGPPAGRISIIAKVDTRMASYSGKVDTTGYWQSTGMHALLGTVWTGKPPDLPAVGIHWHGSGNWTGGQHLGEWALDVPNLGIGPRPNASINMNASYHWPDSLTVTSLDARDASIALGASLHWKNSRLTIPGFTLKNNNELICQGKLSTILAATVRSTADIFGQAGPIEASVIAAPRPLAYWQQWLPDRTRVPVAGAVGASLTLAGDFATPMLDARLTADGLVSAQFPDLPAASLKIAATSDAARRLVINARLDQKDIEPVELALNMPFSPRGWFDDPATLRDLPLAGSVRMANLQIQRYAALVPGAKDISGTFHVAVDIAGTIAAPDFRGRASIDNARIVPRKSNLATLDKTNLTVEFIGSKARVTRGEARFGEGTLTLSGGLDFSNTAEPGIDLQLKGDHILIWRDDDLLVRASPSLNLGGKPGAWKLTGQVAVVESLFFRDFELLPIGHAFTVPKAPSLPKFDPPEVKQNLPGMLSSVALDVRVFTADPVLIRGNLAKGQITGDVTAKGTLAEPSASGSAVVHDMVARLPFSTLKIARGEARFVPGKGWVPDLMVSGESNLPPYKVIVSVTGPATDPRLNLSSEPPLPPGEILALLASGSTTASLEDTGNAQGKALQLLIAQWRNGSLPFGRKIGELLAPLDHVQVQVGQDSPYDGRSRNGATMELTDRLLLTGSMDTDGHQRLTLTLLFRFR